MGRKQFRQCFHFICKDSGSCRSLEALAPISPIYAATPRAGGGGELLRERGLVILSSLVWVDRDSAIYRFELQRRAALAYVGVDVIADLTLNGDREAD